jgi:hypothetical protein
VAVTRTAPDAGLVPDERATAAQLSAPPLCESGARRAPGLLHQESNVARDFRALSRFPNGIGARVSERRTNLPTSLNLAPSRIFVKVVRPDARSAHDVLLRVGRNIATPVHSCRTRRRADLTQEGRRVVCIISGQLKRAA